MGTRRDPSQKQVIEARDPARKSVRESATRRGRQSVSVRGPDVRNVTHPFGTSTAGDSRRSVWGPVPLVGGGHRREAGDRKVASPPDRLASEAHLGLGGLERAGPLVELLLLLLQLIGERLETAFSIGEPALAFGEGFQRAFEVRGLLGDRDLVSAKRGETRLVIARGRVVLRPSTVGGLQQVGELGLPLLQARITGRELGLFPRGPRERVLGGPGELARLSRLPGEGQVPLVEGGLELLELDLARDHFLARGARRTRSSLRSGLPGSDVALASQEVRGPLLELPGPRGEPGLGLLEVRHLTLERSLSLGELDVPMGQGPFLFDQASLPGGDLGDQPTDLLLAKLECLRLVLDRAVPPVHLRDVTGPGPFLLDQRIRAFAVIFFEIVELRAGFLERIVLAADGKVGVLDYRLAPNERRLSEVEGLLLPSEVVGESEHAALAGRDQLSLVDPGPG